MYTHKHIHTYTGMLYTQVHVHCNPTTHLAVLFHQLGEVGEERVLLAEEIKLIVALREKERYI